MSFYVVRNGQPFGPYDAKALQQYVAAGKILLQDVAQEAGGTSEITVREALKRSGVRPRVGTAGGPLGQIKSLGWGLLLPKASFHYRTFAQDQKLLLVSIIGLAPAFLIRFTGSGMLTFYAIALYFSLLWGLFFYSLFKTGQVKVKAALAIFFATQVLILIMVEGLHITSWNPFYKLIEGRNFVSRLLGFTLGVGVFEESLKALPVAILCYRARGPLLPQTAVFYGLISGIGFGVLEGVEYQLTVNSKLGYNDSFFMNIARLTSLPFLHAVWAAIAGYFLSLSFLFPKARYPLRILAIAIPAILHGLYDTFGWSLIGLAVSYLGVGLLIVYLQKAKDFQGRLTP